MVQNKRVNVSFKSKLRRVTDPEEWTIVKHTLESIIDDLWRIDQDCKNRGYTRQRADDNIPDAKFSGLIYCRDCGPVMAAAATEAAKSRPIDAAATQIVALHLAPLTPYQRIYFKRLSCMT